MAKFETSKKYTGVVYTVLQNNDRSYYITYKISGKFHRIHIGKKSEGISEAFCHQKRNEAINNVKFGDDTPIVKNKKKNVITIQSLADVYFQDKAYENRSNSRQLGKYNLHIKPTFSRRDVTCITKSEITTFRNQLSDTKSPKTVNGIIQLLTAIINYSIKEKDLKIINPCNGVKRLNTDNERERFLSLDEIKLLKDEVEHEQNLKTFVLLALVTGGRVQTILNIQKKDIDLLNDTVTLKDIKNDSSYKGFIDNETKQHLQSFIDDLSRNDFIVGCDSSPFPMRTIQRKLLNIINRLFNQGLDVSDTKNRAVIHSLRHTFASQLAIKGIPIFTIKKLMNHADIEQTMRYAKLAPDSGKEAIKSLYT
jgi:integrase